MSVIRFHRPVRPVNVETTETYAAMAALDRQLARTSAFLDTIEDESARREVDTLIAIAILQTVDLAEQITATHRPPSGWPK